MGEPVVKGKTDPGGNDPALLPEHFRRGAVGWPAIFSKSSWDGGQHQLDPAVQY